MYVFPLWSRKDIELANKTVKRSLSGDLKPVTLSPRGKYKSLTRKKEHKLESMPLTTERQRPLHTSRSFNLDSKIGEFNVSIVELSDFTCSAALHVVRL